MSISGHYNRLCFLIYWSKPSSCLIIPSSIKYLEGKFSKNLSDFGQSFFIDIHNHRILAANVQYNYHYLLKHRWQKTDTPCYPSLLVYKQYSMDMLTYFFCYKLSSSFVLTLVFIVIFFFFFIKIFFFILIMIL